ncbi:MAG: patatin-like phospholipase family protein [Alphaproteobacteria bacterium]|nr:patatin-like phospholipase family protein [Alphaproteobacteria bacterium]
MADETTHRMVPRGEADSPGARSLVRKPSVGLVLGGGGARGLAHILMLEVFDEMGIRPAVISGTSIGAIFGAGYASGLTAEQIRAHSEELLRSRLEILRQFFIPKQRPLGRVLNVLQLRSALFNAEALLEIVMPAGTAREFQDAAIPFRVVAADYYTQEQVVLRDGPVLPAVAASMAIPGLFSAVRMGDMALLDGGLVNPLPFDTIKNEADVIVAVNVLGAGPPVEERTPPRATEAMIASLQIFQRTIVREKLLSRRPDVLIEVDVGRINALEFHKLGEVLNAAAPAKEELRRKLERVLSAETLEPDDEADATLSEPPSAKRGRLAQRLLGKR